jgi:flagellar motor switch protein FliG
MGSDSRQPARRLQGPERVAALLLAMGKPLAERLLPHFEHAELKAISSTAAKLGPVPASELEALIEEFANQFAAGLNLIVSPREIEDMLTGVLQPDQIAGPVAEAPAVTEKAVWEQVSALSDTVLAGYLSGEHPQTVALVVSKLDPAKAAKIIAALPEDVRDETMRRMLSSKAATEAAMQLVAEALHEELLANPAKGNEDDPHGRLARIINNLDRDDMETVLQSLGRARPQSAEIVKGLIFTFEDIVSMPARARTTLLDKVQSDRLVLALKGADQALREAVLSGLPARARRVVESELARNEVSPPRELADARREIVNLALELATQGEIELKAPQDEQSGFVTA